MLTGCPICKESHPLCRLKNATVIKIWLLVNFHPATRRVYLPIKLASKGQAVYREKKKDWANAPAAIETRSSRLSVGSDQS